MGPDQAPADASPMPPIPRLIPRPSTAKVPRVANLNVAMQWEWAQTRRPQGRGPPCPSLPQTSHSSRGPSSTWTHTPWTCSPSTPTAFPPPPPVCRPYRASYQTLRQHYLLLFRVRTAVPLLARGPAVTQRFRLLLSPFSRPLLTQGAHHSAFGVLSLPGCADLSV